MNVDENNTHVHADTEGVIPSRLFCQAEQLTVCEYELVEQVFRIFL
jgi:hypothetical protein